MTDLVAGTRVRFRAEFQNSDRRPFSPSSVQVTVTNGGRALQFGVSNGVKQHGIGVYYLDFLLDRLDDSVEVRFSSTAQNQEGEQTTRYAVTVDHVSAPVLDPDVAAALALSEAPEVWGAQPADDARADESDLDDNFDVDRDHMIAQLRESGMHVSDGRSDAYIQAAYRTMQPPSARAAYLRRQRGE